MVKNVRYELLGIDQFVFCLYIYVLSTDKELILRGVNVLSAVRGEYRACSWTEGFLFVSYKQTSFIAQLQTSGSLSIVTALFISFFEGKMFSL
jgi:hypothetical protein